MYQKICLETLKKVLSPKEMKNITGGSVKCWLNCWSDVGGSHWGDCAGADPRECETYSAPWGCKIEFCIYD